MRKSFDLASPIVFCIFLACSFERGLRYRARDQNCRGKCDERMKCMEKKFTNSIDHWSIRRHRLRRSKLEEARDSPFSFLVFIIFLRFEGRKKTLLDLISIIYLFIYFFFLSSFYISRKYFNSLLCKNYSYQKDNHL